MAQAKLSNFFGGNSEEVGLEPVVLYDGARVSNGGDVPLSESMFNFEYLEFYAAFTSAGSNFGLETPQVEPAYLVDTQFGDVLLTQRYGDTSSRVDVKVSPANTTATSLRISAGTSTNWTNPGIYKVIGYRRRISQTGLDEILSGSAQPNLFVNTWHASPKVVNQRSFDGNWAGLAVEDYGYDMWLKTSTTHKGFIVEAGSYTPNGRYLIQADGVVKGEITAPADGDHFSVSFPFASDKFDCRLSNVKVPWHPESSSRRDECLAHYLNLSSKIAVVGGGNSTASANRSILPTKMRRIPDVTVDISFGTGATLDATDISIFQSGAHSSDSVVPVLLLDATIALSDVPNDVQHRFVFN